MSTLEAVMERLDHIAAELAALRNQRSISPPVWEAISVARSTRGIGRVTLMKAITEGRIGHRRVPTHGGHMSWDLCIYDLDRHFPRRTTKKASA